MFRIKLLLIFCINIFFVHSSKASIQTASLKTVHIGSLNPGFQTGDCPASSDGYQYGWHFVFSGSTTSFVSIKCTFQKAGTITKMIQIPTDKHAYVFTPTSDKILAASAVVTGPDTEFVLSHVCNPASKTTSAPSKCRAFYLIDYTLI